MQETNQEADLKYINAKNKIAEILSEIETIKNNDNLKQVQHNIKIFVKTINNIQIQLISKNSFDKTDINNMISKYLCKGRNVGLVNINNPDFMSSGTGHLQRLALESYIQTMQKLLK